MAESILIVDDHPLTRSALAALLGQNGFSVVGEAARGAPVGGRPRARRPGFDRRGAEREGGRGAPATRRTAGDGGGREAAVHLGAHGAPAREERLSQAGRIPPPRSAREIGSGT